MSCCCNGRVGCFPVFVIMLSCGCNGRAGCFPVFVILVSYGCNRGVVCDTGPKVIKKFYAHLN